MKLQFNLTDTHDDLGRFASRSDLEKLLAGFDGIELMHLEEDVSGILTTDMVTGYHMSFPEYWMDFWRGDLEKCILEFDTLDNVRRYYHGDTPEALIRMVRKQYENALAYGAEYAVIHVSDAAIFEEITGKYKYTDAEVIDGFSELINAAIPVRADSDGNRYEESPWLLLENLWQPGLNFKDPDMTARLMDAVRYPKKGIMFDTGHLMHTEPELKTQKEAVQFIHERLDAHKDLCRYIKGLHLHQSLTGSILKRYKKHPPLPAKTYEERAVQLFEYVFRVDQHKPFTGEGVKELVERIDPLYMTFEFISSSLEEHRKLLRRQRTCLQSLCFHNESVKTGDQSGEYKEDQKNRDQCSDR